MLRVSNSVEKNVFVVPQPLIVAAVNTAVVVLQNSNANNDELSGRYIQNVGANDCYYAFGTNNCSPGNFNGVLGKASTVDANGYGCGQQLDVSNCGQQISVYSVGGTTLALTVLKRNDLSQGTGNILTPQ